MSPDAALGLLGLGLGAPDEGGWQALVATTTRGDLHGQWHAVPGSRCCVHAWALGAEAEPWGIDGELRALALALARQGYALAAWRLPPGAGLGAWGLRLRLALAASEVLGLAGVAWWWGEGLEGLEPRPPWAPALVEGLAPVGLGFAPGAFPRGGEGGVGPG